MLKIFRQAFYDYHIEEYIKHDPTRNPDYDLQEIQQFIKHMNSMFVSFNENQFDPIYIKIRLFCQAIDKYNRYLLSMRSSNKSRDFKETSIKLRCEIVEILRDIEDKLVLFGFLLQEE